MAWTGVTRLFLVFFALTAGAAAMAADGSGPPAPIMAVSNTDTDPAAYGWLSDNARKALSDVMAQQKSGALHAFVFTAAPGGDFWSYRAAPKSTDLYSIPDLARAALQSCEFFSRYPCSIVSVSGKDAREQDGGMPVQASQLADQPAAFDATRVPFLGISDQRLVQGYAAEPKAKALVITVTAGWLWRTGDTLFAAAATAFADCQKTYPGQACILYALNSRVVFSAGGPY